MSNHSLRALYIEELRDLYSAETRLVKALPKLAKASSNSRLRESFEERLRQTSEHVSRLEQIFAQLDEKPSGRKCLGMEGLIKEAWQTLEEDYEGATLDAAIISTARRIEHYGIAAYGTVRDFARVLDKKEQVSLLEQNLKEEEETDRKLTELAWDINRKAENVEENSEARASKTRDGNGSKPGRAA